MKHRIKNLGETTLIYANNLKTDEYYDIYDTETKFLGAKITGFKASFETPTGVNRDINEGIIEYYEDDVLKTKDDFYAFWYYFSNNVYYEPANDYNFKIYSVVNGDILVSDTTATPKSLDYKKDIGVKLHQKMHFTKGFLTKCEYYKDIEIIEDEVTFLKTYNYSNIYLEVFFEYHIGVDEFAKYRYKVIRWYDENGDVSEDLKITKKYYNTDQGYQEGVRRRDNIITDLITTMCGLILMTEESITNTKEAEVGSIDVLDAFDTDINKFRKANIEPLITNIATIDVSEYGDLGNWLDNEIPYYGVTIREYCLSLLYGAILNPNEIIPHDSDVLIGI